MKKKKEERRSGRRISAGSIMALLLLAFVWWGVPSILLDAMNPTEAGTYNIYWGPMLPLSSVSGAENVEVSREVTLDFSIYPEPKDYNFAPERVRVTDSYTLTNPTDQPVSVELSWGMEGKLSEQIPVITVDGEPNQASVRIGTIPGGNEGGIENFEEYRDGLLETGLLAGTIAEVPGKDETVKVYHFYNLKYEGTEQEAPPVLGVSYKYSNRNNVWNRNCYMSGTANGREHFYFRLEKDAWLYVIGEDLKELEVGGAIVHTFGTHTASEVEGVTYELETYEASFADCLWEAAQAYTFESEKSGTGVDLVTAEMRYNYAMADIATMNWMPGNSYFMNGWFQELYMNRHMLYWVFPVEIPAGGSVTVTGSYVKESNHNSDDFRHGYDIATTLGSNLHFTEQRVRLVNTEPVAIAPLIVDGEVQGFSQNFGFDLHKGITEVTLDLTQERYYLDLMLMTEQ